MTCQIACYSNMEEMSTSWDDMSTSWDDMSTRARPKRVWDSFIYINNTWIIHAYMASIVLCLNPVCKVNILDDENNNMYDTVATCGKTHCMEIVRMFCSPQAVVEYSKHSRIYKSFPQQYDKALISIRDKIRGSIVTNISTSNLNTLTANESYNTLLLNIDGMNINVREEDENNKNLEVAFRRSNTFM